MKTKIKSLQKFTESESKIKAVLALEIIERKDFEQLNFEEKDKLASILEEQLKEMKGIDRDKFLKKIDAFISDNTRNELWEYNHNRITCSISVLLQEYGRMPSKAEIARNTDLSRQTVHKHLKEYSDNPIFLGQMEQFRFMTSKVLAKVFKFAVNGDMRAAKLYLSMVGDVNGNISGNTLIQNQNNYIQINGTVLSQETVKHLNPMQLKMIEDILKAVV